MADFEQHGDADEVCDNEEEELEKWSPAHQQRTLLPLIANAFLFFPQLEGENEEWLREKMGEVLTKAYEAGCSCFV